MDVAGVALATVIAQTLAMILVLSYLARRRDSSRIYFSRIRLNLEIVWNILKLGIPAGFQSFVFSLSNIVIQSAVNSFGPVYMAGTAASQNVDCFIWISMNAFQPTATTFISRNIGAGNYSRINRITCCALMCACITGIVLGCLAVFFGSALLGIYTGDPAAIATVFQIPRYHTFEFLFLSYPLSWIVTFAALGTAYFFVRGKYPKKNQDQLITSIV